MMITNIELSLKFYKMDEKMYKEGSKRYTL